MRLSRRMFTKEFKLAAVQRLERGSSLGEVARALEVNPNVPFANALSASKENTKITSSPIAAAVMPVEAVCQAAS